jgi:hypothetical protein
MSNIKFKCPQCQAILQADDSDAGWSITCTGCHTQVEVPSTKEASDQIDTEVITKRGRASSEHVEPEVYREIKSMTLRDSRKARAILKKVIQLLTATEKIKYICMASRPILPFMKGDTVVLTNRRFMLFHPRLFGRLDFSDYIWRDLEWVHLREGFFRAGIPFKTITGKIYHAGRLPKMQARKIYSIAQEMEERVREERRMRKMEEDRAASGGVIIQGGMPMVQGHSLQNEDDCVHKLKQLKQMLDEGLISGGEYEAKRQAILLKM